MVVACAALVVALGGTSYAAFVPRNSVGSKQLKGDAVTRTKIKKNAVTGAKIKNGSLGAADLRSGTLPVGVGTLAYRDLTTTADPSTLTGIEVPCPPGLFAISGQIDAAEGLVMQSSYSSNGAQTGEPGSTAWTGFVENATAATDRSFTVIVTCAPSGVIARAAMPNTVRHGRSHRLKAPAGR